MGTAGKFGPQLAICCQAARFGATGEVAPYRSGPSGLGRALLMTTKRGQARDRPPGMIDAKGCLSDQPSVLVLPDWWHESALQDRGSNAVAKAKAATPKKPPAKALATKNGPAVSYSTEPDQVPPPEDAIRLRAYLKWEAAGKPPGDGTDFWLQARQELLANR